MIHAKFHCADVAGVPECQQWHTVSPLGALSCHVYTGHRAPQTRGRLCACTQLHQHLLSVWIKGLKRGQDMGRVEFHRKFLFTYTLCSVGSLCYGQCKHEVFDMQVSKPAWRDNGGWDQTIYWSYSTLIVFDTDACRDASTCNLSLPCWHTVSYTHRKTGLHKNNKNKFLKNLIWCSNFF